MQIRDSGDNMWQFNAKSMIPGELLAPKCCCNMRGSSAKTLQIPYKTIRLWPTCCTFSLQNERSCWILYILFCSQKTMIESLLIDVFHMVFVSQMSQDDPVAVHDFLCTNCPFFRVPSMMHAFSDLDNFRDFSDEETIHETRQRHVGQKLHPGR